MEAATPLNPARRPHTRRPRWSSTASSSTTNAPCAWSASARRRATTRPALVVDAIEIGARVLDREQAGANAEFVKTEFEKAARRAAARVRRPGPCGHRAARHAAQGRVRRRRRPALEGARRALLRRLGGRRAAPGPRDRRRGHGQLARGAAAAVLLPTATRTRWPTSRPRRCGRSATAASVQRPAARGDAAGGWSSSRSSSRACAPRRRSSRRSPRSRREGTAKGRTFEEAVVEAIDAIASAQGDVCEAVGDLLGASGKTGDVLVAIDAAGGPCARARSSSRPRTASLSRPKAMAELDEARAVRDAQFAVLVVPARGQAPGQDARAARVQRRQADRRL